jgi:hypothetical protein
VRADRRDTGAGRFDTGAVDGPAVTETFALRTAAVLSGFLSALLAGLPFAPAVAGALVFRLTPATSPSASRLRLVAAAVSFASDAAAAALDAGAAERARDAAVGRLLPAAAAGAGAATSLDGGLVRRAVVRVVRAAVVAFSLPSAAGRVVRVVRRACVGKERV